jgi:hypothetical protein
MAKSSTWPRTQISTREASDPPTGKHVFGTGWIAGIRPGGDFRFGSKGTSACRRGVSALRTRAEMPVTGRSAPEAVGRFDSTEANALLHQIREASTMLTEE